MCELAGPRGEYAQGCDAGAASEIHGVSGFWADLSEDEFGEESVPFPSDAFAKEAFVEGERVWCSPVVCASGAPFKKGVAQVGEDAEILGSQRLHAFARGTDRREARWCCWIPVA